MRPKPPNQRKKSAQHCPGLLGSYDSNGLMGASILAKTVKGALKIISNKQAKKILQNKGTVTVVGEGTSKKAKKLYKEAHPGKKLKRHDPHPKDPKSKYSHWQRKSGDGSHANFTDKLLGGMVFMAGLLDPTEAITGELGNPEEDTDGNGVPDYLEKYEICP